MKGRMGELSPNLKNIFVILAVGIIVISPQIFQHGNLMLYTDSVFHLNRFYDTYMQIKDHNFQPFIMMYGFNSTGRYINVLYGPILAYLNGLLLFILGSYYKFQLVTNFLVVTFAGLNCLYMLKVGQIKPQLRLYGTILYMTSYAIFAWVLNSQFMGVGAAFTPLVIAVGIRMVTQPEQPVKITEMVVAVTILIQVHVLSAVLSIIFLLITFTYAVFQSTINRKELLQKTGIAAGITIILTINIWLPYIVLTAQNKLVNPFPYADPQAHTLNWSGAAVLLASLICILGCAVLFVSVKNVNNSATKFLGWLGIVILVLASGFFPWNMLFKTFKFLYILQFPFRLAPIAFLLLIYVGFMTLQEIDLSDIGEKFVIIALRVMVCVTILQGVSVFTAMLSQWNNANVDLYSGFMVNKDSNVPFKLQKSFASNDLSQPWRQIAKPVTDYLPATKQMIAWTDPTASPDTKQDNGQKLADLYTKVYLNTKFNKQVKHGHIVVTWHQNQAEPVTLPIAHYKGTRYVLNNQKLTAGQIKTGQAGASVINGQAGDNEVKISYHFGINS